MKDVLLKKQEINTYRNDISLSQSQLSLLAESPYIFHVGKKKEEKEYFTIGSAIDTALTLGDDYFNQVYYISKADVPTGQMYTFCNYLLSLCPDGLDMQGIKEAYSLTGTQISFETFYNKFLKNYEDYYYEKIENIDKECLSEALYYKCKKVIKVVREDVYAGKYFKDNLSSQIPVYNEIHDIPCKALLDKVDINDKNKTIRAIDLKTTGKSVYDFVLSYILFRYDLQGSFYFEMLSKFKEKNKDYKDYKILPTIFVVVEKELINPLPLIYEMSDDEIYKGKHGRTLNGKRLKGWNELIQEFKIRNKTNNWLYPIGYEKWENIKINVE